MAMLGGITVICMSCKAMAPYTPPDLNHPYGVYHWHQPCPQCGAENWAAHDIVNVKSPCIKKGLCQVFTWQRPQIIILCRKPEHSKAAEAVQHPAASDPSLR